MQIRNRFNISAMIVTTLLIFANANRDLMAITPLPADPFLLKSAPEECIFFMHSFGMTSPAAGTKNKTELLFQEPEVKKFIQGMDKLILNAIEKTAAEQPGDIDAEIGKKIYDWMKLAATNPFTIYLSDIELEENSEPKEISAGLVFKAGGRVNEAKQLIEEMVKDAPADVMTRTKVAGIDCYKFTEGGKLTVFVGIKDEYVIATVGQDSFASLLERAKTKVPKWLSSTVKRLDVPRRSTIVHVDISKITATLEKVNDPKVLTVWSALGFDNMTSASFVAGLDDRGALQRVSIKSDRPFTGLLQPLNTQPLEVSDLKAIPDDALFAAAWRLSPKQMLETVLNIGGDVDARARTRIEQQIDVIAEQTGIHLTNDLFNALGDKWILYNKGVGFMGIPDAILSVNIADAKKLEQTHAKILQLVRPQLQGVKLSERTTSGIKYFSVTGGPIVPAWCITDSHFSFAMSARLLRSHLRRKAGDPSLADNTEITQRWNSEQKPIAVSYTDTKTSLKMFFDSMPILLGLASGELQKQGIDFDSKIIPTWDAIGKHLDPSIHSLHLTEDGLSAESQETLPITSGATVGAPTMILLLLPAVNAARSAARRAQTMNHMKYITLALVKYESAHGYYPPAYIRTKDGKPGLSWRVAILPFLEEQELYEEFRLDEPWDSDHNKKLIARMPEIYQSPAGKAGPTKTNYLAIRTDQAVLAPSETKRGVKINQVKDGISHTIMLVESNDDRAVPWTKPDDFTPDASNPFAGLGDLHPGDIFLISRADGSVGVIPKATDKKILQSQFTRSADD